MKGMKGGSRRERARERILKQKWQNINIWGIWVKSTWVFFVLVLELPCKSEIISK